MLQGCIDFLLYVILPYNQQLTSDFIYDYNW